MHSKVVKSVKYSIPFRLGPLSFLMSLNTIIYTVGACMNGTQWIKGKKSKITTFLKTKNVSFLF